MTAPVETKTGARVGVVRVIGPVVDAEFPRDAMPDIFNALHVDVTLSGGDKTLTLEVAQHLGDNMVRAISMQPTDGLVRGAEVRDTGSPITVPVGDAIKGHVFNAIGECLNLKEGEKLEVERAVADPPQGPGLRRPGAEDRDAGDRHQGHRPARPVRQGRQDRPVRRRGRGQDGAHPGDDHPGGPQLRWYLGLRRRG